MRKLIDKIRWRVEHRLSHVLYVTRLHWLLTVATGLVIRPTRYRFDSTWRHSDDGLKAWFYLFVCTFAANYIADDGTRFGVHQIQHWRNYL